MPFDFTLAAFDHFCQRATHMPVFTLADYLQRMPPLPRPYLILRVDVDYREQTAVTMAHIASWYGLRGSFYFRHRNGGFDTNAIKMIAALGHEIGYHFETLDTCQGNFEQAEKLFLTHLKQLRGAGFAVETVAAHGAQPTASTYRTNYDLFTHTPDLFERAQLRGETTISVDFNQVAYLSDAGWRWRKHANYVHGSKGKFTSLRKIQQLMICPDAALYINFHPHQWHPDPARMFYYRNRNRIGMWILPKLHKTRHQ